MEADLKAVFSMFICILILASVGVAAQARADSATFEAWDFIPAGEVLAMTTIKDLSRDRVDELVVAAKDRSIYVVSGATGEKLWNFTGADFYIWKAVVTNPEVDVNANARPDVLVASSERLVMMLDGLNGKRLWAYNVTDLSYRPGSACSILVRSAHFISDIDGDGILDSAVVSGTGDNCAQKDRVEVIAFSSKNGKQLWEYSKAEDYHGLKDGTDAASPVAVRDFNKDGFLDVAFADEQSLLKVINGRTGIELRSTDLGVFGSVWDFTEMPDVTGDGVADALALEFVEGGGGPDYASIDAIDLMNSKAIWQVKVGDGRINGGALFSAVSLNGTAADQSIVPQVAVTLRIENELKLVLLDAKTGAQKWEYELGEERSRDDLNKVYPVARIATAGARDELAVGSIDSKMYLLNPVDASIIWSHAVTGEIGGMTYVSAPSGQKYIIVEDSYRGIRALSRQTSIPTSLTIAASAKTVVESSKVVISGTLSPAFPGELIEIRYVDPTGAVATRPLILSRDGTYTDLFEPLIAGTWKVSTEFIGEGFYLSSKSPTISFTVVEETESQVYELKVPDEAVSYPISYFVDGGVVGSMNIIKETKTLRIDVNPSGGDGSLKIDLPRNVIDAFDSQYRVFVDGKETQYQELEADESLRSLSIPFKQDSNEITIIGTYIVPEFPVLVPLLAIAMFAVAALGLRSRLIK